MPLKPHHVHGARTSLSMHSHSPTSPTPTVQVSACAAEKFVSYLVALYTHKSVVVSNSSVFKVQMAPNLSFMVCPQGDELAVRMREALLAGKLGISALSPRVTSGKEQWQEWHHDFFHNQQQDYIQVPSVAFTQRHSSQTWGCDVAVREGQYLWKGHAHEPLFPVVIFNRGTEGAK